MADLQFPFPAPPEAVWNALPAGVDAVRGHGPHYDAQRGLLSTRTGTTWRSWGQEIVAQVSPAPGGSTLTVRTSLKFGVVDWGEGKKLCTRFGDAVAGALGLTPPAR
ncbi:hypothetical protein CFN78_24550 [Amycolatopsis antarctica]|uniref:Polyketide cyclase n=1 Tax=Amycolatopsis antarctica TaxID=1854586 RepID=A0A263CYT5_9PSEU|nr:hypothetical protein [Amycolatopsis antarctica]OZM70577.1 hypothetical protein CFN78_24550 [Amycolatopsis antarctica]